MAKKVTGYVKLQIPAGKANPSPPVGPALGQHGSELGDGDVVGVERIRLRFVERGRRGLR